MPVSGGQPVLFCQLNVERVTLAKSFEVLGESVADSHPARAVAHGYRLPRSLSFRSLISVYRPIPADRRATCPSPLNPRFKWDRVTFRPCQGYL